MSFLCRWREGARSLKRESAAMYFALRDPRTPWYAKVAAACVVAYALSPIDLIPDPIPVLGYLDDLILLPIAIWVVRRLIPSAVLAEGRAKAEADAVGAPGIGMAGAVVIVLLWAATIAAIAWAGFAWWGRRGGR
jgi:uncharacterized membrane protein YkvA (DUF1232 family)